MNLSLTTRHIETPCPYCGHKLDASTNLKDGVRPAKGDFTVCIECAHILVYNEDLTIRVATPQEIIDLWAAQPDSYYELQRYRDAIVAMSISRGESRFLDKEN